MNVAPYPRMSSDEFLRWSMEQPEGMHFELVGGKVLQMAAERSAHALAKLHITLLLVEAVRAAGLACTVYPDGMAVEVDPGTVYEPDALVRSGEPLADDELRVVDPIVVVEVLSPSSRSLDSGRKLADYFRIPSVRHYLVVDSEARVVVHHRRDEGGAIAAEIVRDGSLRLDPPGVLLDNLFSRRPPE